MSAPSGHARSPGMSIMSLLSDDNPSSQSQTPKSPLAYQQSPPQHPHPHQQPGPPPQYATTFSYSQIQPRQGAPVEYQQQQHYPPPQQQYQTQYQHPPQASPPLQQQQQPPQHVEPPKAAPPPAKAPATPATPATPAAPAAAPAPTTAAAKKAAKAASTAAAAAAKSTTAAAKRKKTDDPAPKKGKKKQKKDDQAQQTVGSIPIVTGSDDKVTARPKENIPPPPSVPMSPGKKQAQGLDAIGQNKDAGRGSKPEVTLRLRIRLAGGNVKVKPSQSVLKKSDKAATMPEPKQYVIDNKEYDFYSTPDKANDWTASADDTTVLNFTRLAEDKYGYDHVHPNQALDLVDDDGEVEDDDEEEEDKEKEEKEMKRRQRVEGKYDLNDPFIDDTETAWEEQQASTQDGFFVYSGPLIEEAPKPVETKKPAKKPGPKKKTTLAAKDTETKKKTTPLASATTSTTSTTASTTTSTTPATAEKKA
ncbi:Histone promoter control protein 2 [Yarrowia sp. B02]|nr:Histone promoter control protein 2 [Yarrowia sp. B02]